jgi:hypothetical protein
MTMPPTRGGDRGVEPCPVRLDDNAAPRQSPPHGGRRLVGLCDPDPAARLGFWHQLARGHISHKTCVHLARGGFPELAAEFLRLRGDLP